MGKLEGKVALGPQYWSEPQWYQGRPPSAAGTGQVNGGGAYY